MANKKKKKKTTTKSKEESEEIEIHHPGTETNSLEWVRLEKKKGNTEFHKKNYTSAALHYSTAIAASKIQPKSDGNNLLVSLFTNRAISNMYLKVYISSKNI
jgi:hypothetical protein